MEDAAESPPPLFVEWLEHLDQSIHIGNAVDTFFAVARRDSSKPDDASPQLPALNYGAPRSKSVKVRFDLSEPKGDHDHYMYKDINDLDSRAYAGQRRLEDYDQGRAERVRFIPIVLIDPGFVYVDSKDPWTIFYVSRTGSDEYFMVVVHKREKGEPRFSFVTAYPLTVAKLDRKRRHWRKLFDKAKSGT